jgi:hypothetical protein
MSLRTLAPSALLSVCDGSFLNCVTVASRLAKKNFARLAPFQVLFQFSAQRIIQLLVQVVGQLREQHFAGSRPFLLCCGCCFRPARYRVGGVILLQSDLSRLGDLADGRRVASTVLSRMAVPVLQVHE